MKHDISGYFSATADKLKRKAFSLKSMAQIDATTSGRELEKALNAVDLTFLGIGGIIGAGVFVLTGVAASEFAGPGVVFSYITASLSALLSAFCYAEFAAEIPVAGGAFVYIAMVFGELAGWVSASNLVLEYTLSAAAIARSFTSYTATLFGAGSNALRIPVGDTGIFQIDIPAFVIVLVVSALLARDTQAGARFNTGVTIVNLAVILFVLCAGLPSFNAANFVPLLPFGLRGVFTGASKVFFSFIGFDSVATVAEEARHPAFDLPMGIIASLLICSVLYVAMCVTICGMVYYAQIDINAPFAAAFVKVDMQWASHIVSLGALAGIITSLLVGLLGQADVNEVTKTPLHATIVTAFTAGLFALLVDLEALADLVSIGILSVYLMVSAACVWKRYQPSNEPIRRSLAVKVVAVIAMSLAASISYTAAAPNALTLVILGLWTGCVASLYWEEVVYVPKRFSVPLSPAIPSLSILANAYLIASLGEAAYVRLLVWLLLSSAVYVIYGVHHTIEPDADLAADGQGFGGFRFVAHDDPFLDMVNCLDDENFDSALELTRQPNRGTTVTPRRAALKGAQGDSASRLTASPTSDVASPRNVLEMPES